MCICYDINGARLLQCIMLRCHSCCNLRLTLTLSTQQEVAVTFRTPRRAFSAIVMPASAI